MEHEIHEQFRALRRDNELLRAEVREDIRRLHAKLDEHLLTVQARCARRGEALAVLAARARESERRIDRRIALGLLLLATLTLLFNLLQ
jgi:hypothetical protein